ncbi:hypothetical protein D9757_012651 [Collybiopsis confluens]|uniref:Cerato-platanin n=1 Tax=Collybiopsis confluens TaxID=2823264 RepID=A0A8H5D5N6_9AGAR|nr:hypothetical protein D9757_012651 [Collybiopsis confluens]
MKNLLLQSILALTLSQVSVFGTLVKYDTAYDDSTQSLLSVACSDGVNGLLTKGYTTFGTLRAFPRIGGASAVAGWNSSTCGSCWALDYNSTIVKVLAVDHTDSVNSEDVFILSQAAMDELTGGNAVAFGRVEVASSRVNSSICGL